MMVVILTNALSVYNAKLVINKVCGLTPKQVHVLWERGLSRRDPWQVNLWRSENRSKAQI